MGLDQLKKEILDAAEKRAAEIDSQATAQMHEIVKNAHNSAGKTAENMAAEAKAFVEAERSERTSAARLEAQRMLSEAREAAVNAALEKAYAAFVARRNSPSYRESLHMLADRGIEELGSSKPTVLVNSQDRKFFSGSKYRVGSEALECAGGVVVESPDGRIRVNYTLEEIFASQREEIRKEIYAQLFAGESDDVPAELAPSQKKAKGKSGKRKAGRR